MKVLIVVPGLHNGGTITSLKNLLPKLNRKKYSIDVFPINLGGTNFEAISQYANVVGFANSNMNISKKFQIKYAFLCLLRYLKKILCLLGVDLSPIMFKRVVNSLQKNNYDLIIAFQEGQATLLVSLFKDVKKVAWVRCDYSRVVTSAKIKKKSEKVYRNIDKIVCVSSFTKDVFVQIHPDCSDKTISLHNIISDDAIINKSREIIVDDVNYYDSDFTIVSVGRLDPVKRFDKIPLIASYIKKEGLSFKWLIIGDGSDREKISDSITKNNVEDTVVLLGNRNNPYPYIAKANLLVCTSSSEACPNVINEAKILSVPVASTNFGSVHEFIENGINGVISPLETIAIEILRLMKDYQWYDKIKENIATFKYENEKLLAQLEKEILETINCNE